jgi:hypothetical protein
MTDQEIEARIQELETNIKELKKDLAERQLNKNKILAQTAKATNDPILVALADAMMHHLYSVLPKTKVAYTLADISRTIDGFEGPMGHPLKLDTEEKTQLLRQLLQRFSPTDYIFNHTHYDECDNGFFFRRS